MRLWPGTLLAFAAWLVIVPESASAQCSSHYVPSIPLSWGAGNGLTSTNRVEDLAADRDDIPRVPKPCTGAMCSGQPAMPVSPAPPQILRVGIWAILEDAAVISSPDRLEARPQEGNVRPTRIPSLIFHPPRPSSRLHTS